MSALSIVALIEDERDLDLLAMARPLGALTALSVAAPAARARVESALSRSLALGAERAVLVSDAVLDGVDYLGVAHALACAVRHLCDGAPEGSVVVVAGDRGRGAVGPSVAERLSMPHLGAVVGAERRDAELHVTRRCGAELRSYHGAPPVLLACAPSPASETATVAAEPTASPSPIALLALETLEVSAHELNYRRRFRPSPGAGPSPRPHVVASVEVLRDRLVRDRLWPLGASGKVGAKDR